MVAARRQGAAASLVAAAWLAAASGAAAYCNECHIRNAHTKDFATQEAALEGTVCSYYADNSCCNVTTAENLGSGELYGDEWRWDRCGPLSAECEAWFHGEGCLYECDVHAGRFRLHQDCTDSYGGENGWQMFGMPIMASQCDAWFEACKDDLFCACHEGAPCAEDWMVPGSYFSLPTLECSVENGECVPFSQLYADGRQLCENMWDGAFLYSEDEGAYAMRPELLGRHNNDVAHTVAFPDTCNPNATIADTC